MTERKKIRKKDLQISKLQTELDVSIVAKRSVTLMEKKYKKYKRYHAAREKILGDKQLQTKPGGKTYTPTMCMMVYDAIVCQVPTYNIPDLNQDLSEMWCYCHKDMPVNQWHENSEYFLNFRRQK